jgi:transcriptional regulator with XRE-family HTH domain
MESGFQIGQLRLFSFVANDLAKRLLARVRELRKAKGLTQESFAERAGLKYKYYQQVEAGRRVDIRFSTLQKLAKACDLELWELLKVDAPLPVAEEIPGRVKPKSKATEKSR